MHQDHAPESEAIYYAAERPETHVIAWGDRLDLYPIPEAITTGEIQIRSVFADSWYDIVLMIATDGRTFCTGPGRERFEQFMDQNSARDKIKCLANTGGHIGHVLTTDGRIFSHGNYGTTFERRVSSQIGPEQIERLAIIPFLCLYLMKDGRVLSWYVHEASTHLIHPVTDTEGAPLQDIVQLVAGAFGFAMKKDGAIYQIGLPQTESDPKGERIEIDDAVRLSTVSNAINASPIFIKADGKAYIGTHLGNGPYEAFEEQRLHEYEVRDHAAISGNYIHVAIVSDRPAVILPAVHRLSAEPGVDGQYENAGAAFPAKLAIRASGEQGQPVPDALLHFTVEGHLGAHFDGSTEHTLSARTGEDGVATLPSALVAGSPGNFSVHVVAEGSPDASATLLFHVAAQPAKLEAQPGVDQQRAETGAAFGRVPSVRATDANEQAAPNALIRFTIEGHTGARFEHGEALEQTARTDAGGIATLANAVLAGEPGTFGVRILPDGNPDAELILRLHVPAKLELLTAAAGVDGQHAYPEAHFAKLPQVHASDLKGRPAAERQVLFVLDGDARFIAGEATRHTATTDDQGNAVAPAILAGGGSGTVQLTVSAPGSAATAVRLTLQVDPLLTGLQASVEGGQPSAAAGAGFAQRLVVAAAGKGDLRGIALEVRLEGETGSHFADGGQTRRIALDGEGKATVPAIVAGPKAGALKVVIAAPDFPAVAAATADYTVTAAAARTLSRLTVPDAIRDQWTTPGKPFPHPLAAQAWDERDQPIEGVQIEFSLSTAKAHFGSGQAVRAVTRADGQATAGEALTAGSALGYLVVTAAATWEGVSKSVEFVVFIDPEARSETPGSKAGGLERVPPNLVAAVAQAGQLFPFETLGRFKASTDGAAVKGLAVTMTLLEGAGATAEVRFIVAGKQLTAQSVTRVTDEAGLVDIPPIVSVGKAGHYQVHAEAANLYNPNAPAIAVRELEVLPAGSGTR